MPVVSTPNNGLHVFFKQPNGEALGNVRGSLPPGIDVRGDGDTPLIMLWPSTFCTRGSMGFFTAYVVPKFGSLDDPAPTSSRA
jgi:Bifunctional DNA primase/polymerase, N-terminal